MHKDHSLSSSLLLLPSLTNSFTRFPFLRLSLSCFLLEIFHSHSPLPVVSRRYQPDSKNSSCLRLPLSVLVSCLRPNCFHLRENWKEGFPPLPTSCKCLIVSPCSSSQPPYNNIDKNANLYWPKVLLPNWLFIFVLSRDFTDFPWRIKVSLQSAFSSWC